MEQANRVLKFMFYGICCTAGICSEAVEIMARAAEKEGKDDIATASMKAFVDDLIDKKIHKNKP